MFKLPKISCLTVTNGRFEWLKRTIRCYVNQTYSNKELVILSQGNKEINRLISDYIRIIGRDDILFFECSPTMSLGAMRNLSIEISSGEILCQWDDDDYSHPRRMVNQYHHLLKGNVSASVYTQHLKYYYQTGDIYWIDWSIEKNLFEKFLPGTIMFRKNIFHKMKNLAYPEIGLKSIKEEDLCFLQNILKTDIINPVEAGNQYIYTYHGLNTYKLEHHNFVLAKKVLEKEELLKRKDLLIETLRLVQIDRPVKIRSLKEVAFEYQP